MVFVAYLDISVPLMRDSFTSNGANNISAFDCILTGDDDLMIVSGGNKGK